jgi:hypothetical protein
MFLGVSLCGESIVCIPGPWKCFPDTDSGKNGLLKMQKMTIFASKIQFFLNQGNIFRVWECAQSIPRIKLPLEGTFLGQYIFVSQKFTKIHFFGAPCIIFANPYIVKWLGSQTPTLKERIWSRSERFLFASFYPLSIMARTLDITIIDDYRRGFKSHQGQMFILANPKKWLKQIPLKIA